MKCRNLLITLLLIAPLASFAEPTPNAPLRVGLILPLTGVLAEYGQAFQNGVNLALGDSTEVAKNCTFITEDSKYDSKSAVAAFHKLTSSDLSVVYNWGGPTSEALAPLADQKNIALFVWTADPKVAEGRSHVIRFSNSGADYGGTLAQYLAGKGYHKVAIVKTENQYINAILNGLQAAADKKFEIDVVDSYQPGEADFRTTITKLKARKFDAVGIFLLSGQVSNFAKQLKAQKLSAPLFGTDFFESMTEVTHAQGGLSGAVFANNIVSSNFAQAYVKRFGNDFQINHAANGYDFASFLCKQVQPKLQKHTAQEILSHSLNVPSLSGEQGQAEFTTSEKGDKYFRFPVIIRRITDTGIVTE